MITTLTTILYVFTTIVWGIFATKMHMTFNRQDKRIK